MTSKVIILKGNKTEAFVKILASQFGVHAESELKLIALLLHYQLTNSFHLSQSMRERLRRDLGIGEETFKTSLLRLRKKDVLIKTGKNWQLDPGFNGLDKIDEIKYRCKE
jgi:hypothetical protein